MTPITKRIMIVFCGIFLLSFFTQCHNYYKATTLNPGSSNRIGESIDSLKQKNRYFVLRNGNQAFYMRNIVLSADQKALSCILDTLPPEHQLHLVRGRMGKMQYKRSNPMDLMVIDEVHFYTPVENNITAGEYSLALEKVQKIEVLEIDKKRTTSSYVIGALGYSLGTLAVVSIIALALKSSCPFVSAHDGTQFTLQGEIYGGAIYPQLARHDYMPLKMAPLNDGTLQLKISNELLERQYTDMADLLVITHDIKTRVLSNETGVLYSISNPQSPTRATLNQNKDVLSALNNSGDYEMLYMDDSSRSDARNEVLMEFEKPAHAARGKLILSLKNSYWLDLLYGELAKGFGSYYTTYIKQQRSKPVAELLKWTREQQLPLEVSVKTAAGWKKVADITTIGPLAIREIIVPVDLAGIDDTITEIRLSAGFMFWEIDYAAMDFSNDDAFTVQKLSPQSATDELGKNVLAQLEKEDGLYLEQPLIGNTATLVYKTNINTDKSKTQTYILHAKGYYEHIRDFKNKPDIEFLKQFTQPNAFPVYGMKRYQKIRKEALEAFARGN